MITKNSTIIVVRKMKKVLLKMIDIYQKTPGHIHSSCRYIPTCSEYARQAIILRGSFIGTLLTIKRIIRCNPLGGSGLDPVPTKETKHEKEN